MVSLETLMLVSSSSHLFVILLRLLKFAISQGGSAFRGLKMTTLFLSSFAGSHRIWPFIIFEFWNKVRISGYLNDDKLDMV